MTSKLEKITLPLVLKDKVVLKEGTWNGNFYPADEIKRLVPILNEEPKDPSEKNRNSVFVGDAEDHQDSTGTWVGRAHGFYWDEGLKALVAKEVHVVDENAARKIAYQLEDEQGTSWGISPRLEVRKEGNVCKDIVMKSLALVLEPAGGEDLLLAKKKETVNLNHSIGGNAMTDEEIRQTVVEAVVLELERFKDEFREELKKARETESARLKKLEETEEERRKREEAEKKAAEEENKKKKAAEEKETDGDLAANKKKKPADENTEDEENKKNSARYPFNSKSRTLARHILPRKFNLSGFDEKSLRRLSEDLADAFSNISGEGVTLQKYEEALSALESVLYTIPVHEPDAAALKAIESQMNAEEEALNKKVEERVSRIVETLRNTKGERKGLVKVLLDNRPPKEPAEASDPREQLGAYLGKHGVPKQ
jgi:hypothetical protein